MFRHSTIFFVELFKNYGGEEYDFRIRKTQTYEIIEYVAKQKSEVRVYTEINLTKLF